MKSFTNLYVFVGEWALNIFLLNLLWFLFSTLGLFVLGIFPATAALFAVMRKLVMTSEEVPIFRLFWKTFKDEFVRSNLLGYVLVAAGLILYIDLRVLQQLEVTFLHQFMTIVTFLLIFIYVVILLYVFPIFVHFNLKTFQYIKYAFILAIGRPLQSLLMVLVLAGLFFVLFQIPGLIPVFGASLISFTLMKMTSKSLPGISSSTTNG